MDIHFKPRPSACFGPMPGSRWPARRLLAAAFAAVIASLVVSAGSGGLAVSPANAADPASTSPGNVRFAKAAQSDFDVYTSDPTQQQKDFMNSHYWRMRTYEPYFDSRTSWFSRAWAHQNLYAIYVDEELASKHPEWILRDASGNKLYIPFDCSGSSCPQYAADVGDPAFRSFWISRSAAVLSHGYRGLFVDDVNMLFRVGNGAGDFVAPIDPRTGQEMTDEDWRRYIAEFVEQIRAAFPNYEIVHNPIWFAGHDDPYVQRELLSADYVEIERGVNDDGLTGGAGQFALRTLFSHIDWLHAHGKPILLDSNAATDPEREYGLASYFLVSTGLDSLGNDPGSTPDDWWSGYDVQLGAPLGDRYDWNGVLRRDFEHGVALVNEPEAPQRTLDLEKAYTTLGGQQTSSVTLGAARGAVLLGDAPVPSSVTPIPTHTTVEPISARSSGRTSELCETRGSCRNRGPTSHSVLVVGRVRGADSGRTRLTLHKRERRRWVTVRRTTTRVKAARPRHGKPRGVFKKRFTNLREGRYAVCAGYRGSPQAKASVSRYRRFTIRKR